MGRARRDRRVGARNSQFFAQFVRCTPRACTATPPLTRDAPRAQLKLEKGELPPAVPEDYATNEEFLKALHHVLLEVEIVEGVLVCPETDKRFPIKEGIPSML